MSGFDANGFTAATLEEILAAIEAEQRSNVSATLDQSADSPLGELNAIVARQIRQLWELIQAVNSGYSEDATGFALTARAALTGSFRRAATPSTVPDVTVNVDPGTYAAGTLVAYPTGSATDLFENATDVVNGGGSPADIDVDFVAQSTGPTVCNAGTLVNMIPVSGWNSVTNTNAATLGEVTETDAELRSRRLQEISGQGSSTVLAIRKAVAAVADVVSVYVNENDTDTVQVIDSINVPAHAIEVVVRGGASADIAEAIWLAKAAGITAFGSSTGTFVDENGESRDVDYTVPTERRLYIDVTVITDPDTYAGDTAVADALETWGAANLAEDDDVIGYALACAVMDVEGVTDIQILEFDFSASPTNTNNLAITSREYATIDAADVTVSS